MVDHSALKDEVFAYENFGTFHFEVFRTSFLCVHKNPAEMDQKEVA